MSIRTERLVLRQWREDDLAAYVALNADPEVGRWFDGTLTPDESARQLVRLRDGIAERGFGFWAVDVPGIAASIGFVGVQPVPFDAPFGKAIEVGWRLARAHWGHGYATEGAQASLRYGFATLGLEEIVAMVVPENLASRRVAERIGMSSVPGDAFDHPSLPPGDALRRHMLYRLRRPAWERMQANDGVPVAD